MLVIVEGQRNAGKTTAIAEFLRIANEDLSPLKRYQPEEIKVPRPQFPIKQITRDFMQKGFEKNRVWVIDRAHISEQVYQELTDRNRTWTDSEMSWAEYFLSQTNTLLVYLSLSVSELKSRSEKTLKPSEGDIEEIKRLFDMKVRRSCLEKLVIECDGMTPTKIATIIHDDVYRAIQSYRDIF